MKRNCYPIGLIAAALAGAALQFWCQSAAFDPATRLAEPGAAPLLALWAYFCAVPVLALAAALALRGRSAPGRGELYAGGGLGSRLLGALAGVLLAAAGLLRLAGRLGALPAFRWTELGACLVDALFCAGGVCVVWLSAGPDRPRPRSLAALIPGFGVCFWLVLYYHTETRDPVLARYVWTLLCLMAAALALYHQAAWAFGRPAPVRTQWLTLTAGAYAFSALPAAQSLPEGLVLLGLGCWMLRLSARIPALTGPADGQREGGPRAEPEEAPPSGPAPDGEA